MSLIVKTSVACIHTMRARLLQSWVVDINVGRIAIVDSAKLVVDAGRIFCKTIVCFYFRANFLSIVLVSELYSRSKLTDGSWQQGVQLCLVVVQAFVHNIFAQSEVGIKALAWTRTWYIEICETYKWANLVLCQIRSIGIVEINDQLFGTDGRRGDHHASISSICKLFMQVQQRVDLVVAMKVILNLRFD